VRESFSISLYTHNSKRRKLYVNKGGMSTTGSINYLMQKTFLNKSIWVWVCSIPSNNPLVLSI
jgi:hypothetical protein